MRAGVDEKSHLPIVLPPGNVAGSDIHEVFKIVALVVIHGRVGNARPLLRLAGGVLLLWIAVNLVRPGGRGEGAHRPATSLWQAVWIIVVADVTMSLDNVLAVAAAARGDLLLVAFGIALSLPIVVWGSGLLARLMADHAWIIWVGGGVLGYVAGEMMIDDPILRAWLGAHAEIVDDVLSLLLAAGLTLLGWWLARGAASGPAAREKA